jgi:hypothetical protein
VRARIELMFQVTSFTAGTYIGVPRMPATRKPVICLGE